MKPYAVHILMTTTFLYIIGEYYGCKPGVPDTGRLYRERQGSSAKDRTLKRLSGSSGLGYMAALYRRQVTVREEIFATEGVYWVRADNDRLADYASTSAARGGKLNVSNCVHD